MRRLGAALLLGALLLAPSPASQATLPGEAPGVLPEPPFHQGELLAASPEMGDPRFRQAVILLVRHGAGGAFGLVLNKPVSEVPLADLMRRFRVPGEAGEETVRLHYGGPVQPELGFVLHTLEAGPAPRERVNGWVGMSPIPEVLQAIAEGRRPAKLLFVLGYAGWGPGQLEAEMAQGAWETAPADEDILFDPGHETKWERAMERRTRTL